MNAITTTIPSTSCRQAPEPTGREVLELDLPDGWSVHLPSLATVLPGDLLSVRAEVVEVSPYRPGSPRNEQPPEEAEYAAYDAEVYAVDDDAQWWRIDDRALEEWAAEAYLRIYLDRGMER